MSDALHGLIGALGGAALGAMGAYLGPLRQQREAALQAAVARMYAERHEKIQRLVEVRSALREWNILLNRTFNELQDSRRNVDMDRFRQDELNAMNAGWKALDAVMHDWVGLRAEVSSGHPLADGTFRPPVLTEALTEYGLRISQAAQDGPGMSHETFEELTALSDRAWSARGHLSEAIERRLEAYMSEGAPRRRNILR
ncbi:hypothetical protein ACOBQB_09825 [Streptomyces sp. G5(2025)]|uniref:hypothetical protein n=1 Tax=Streptomyces sp. G5(2025) TaxID=3406628 RepID=UPI003C1EC324